MNSPFLSPEDVADLGMTLREAGYGVGPDQCIAAQRLIVTLAAQGVRFADRRALASWLAPVFCGSPTEQADFAAHYEGWLTGRGELVPQPTLAPNVMALPYADGSQTSRAFRMFVAFVLLAGVLAASLLAYQIHYELAMRTVRGTVVNYKGVPVPEAAVSFRGKQIQSDKDGSFPLAFRLLELPAKITADKDGFEQSLELNSSNYAQPITLHVGPPVEAPTPKFNPSRLDLTAAEADFLKNTPHVQPRLPEDPTSKAGLWQRIYRRYYWFLFVVAASMPLLLTFLWMLWQRLPRLQLIRWKSQEGIRLDALRVKGSGTEFFTSPGFRRITQQLRRHRLFESRELDAERTVVKSAGRGGWFTPVYLWQKRLPDFLILIDRAGFRDLQGHLIDDLVRNLRAGRVEIDCYDFYSDPRVCYLSADKPPVSQRREEGAVSAKTGAGSTQSATAVAVLEEEDRSGGSAPAQRFSLEDLLAKHPNHNLFIFSDTSGFFSPLSGHIQPWVEQFSQWTFRALLVPERMVAANTDQRTRILQDSGFLILSATERGLSTAVDVLDGGEAERADLVRIGRLDSGDAYPSLLSGDDLRWLSDFPPRPSQVSLLVGQLRAYLGREGFQWLAACAIYPELLWDLTVYLGHELKVLGRDEQRLSLLLRLPWFRHGSMPDWLRERLMEVMPPADREKVRDALWRLLETALEKPLDGIHLPYATDEPPKPFLDRFRDRLRDRLRTQWLKRLLSNFIHTEPAGSPLRDYVFLSALHGRKPGKGLPVPDKLRQLWRRFGEPRRRVIQIMAGVLATTAVSVAMYHYRPKPPEPPGNPQPLPAPTGPAPYHLSLDDLGIEWAKSIESGGTLVFQTAGDTGSDDPAISAAVAGALEDQARASNSADSPAFLYLLGNLVYDNGAAKNYIDQFYGPYRDYPGFIFAIPGNYDGTPASGEPSLQAFVRNFCVRAAVSVASTPSTPRAGGLSSGPRRQPNSYWTLETPFATIIGLYSNVVAGGFIDDTQQAWVVSELKNAPADKALIVAVHQPVYSIDKSQASDYLGGVLDRAMLAAGRAPDLVLSAHDNNYQRFARQLSTRGRTVPYIVSGAGGSNLRPLPASTLVPFNSGPGVTLQAFDGTHHGFLVLTVTRSKLAGDYFTVSEPGSSALIAGPADHFSIDLAGPKELPPPEFLPTEIKGLVVDPDKKRVAGVEVSISSGERVVGQTTTSVSGVYRLPIPTGVKPGDPVQVQIPGWEIQSPIGGKTSVPVSGVLTAIVVRKPGETGNPPPSQVQDQSQPSQAQVQDQSQQTPPSPNGNIFDNWNTGAVVNHPTQATRFTIKEPYYITHIWNYHWNNGRGAKPGSIGLRGPAGADSKADSPASSGPNSSSWPASAAPGQGGVPNVAWEATPNVTIPAGTYEITDSDPGTWSHNAASGFAGFSRVEGFPAANSKLGPTLAAPTQGSAGAPTTQAEQSAPAASQSPTKDNANPAPSPAQTSAAPSAGTSQTEQSARAASQAALQGKVFTDRAGRPGVMLEWVILEWTQAKPAQGPIASYSIYRGTSSGGPYQKIASGVTNPAFTDYNVSSGKTYYYVVMAVDQRGLESIPSSEFKAVIPYAPSSK